MRTLETLRKMRKEEFGTGNGEGEMADGKSQMADGKSQMADGKSQMADGKSQMADGKSQMADGKSQMADGKSQMADGKSQMADGKSQMADGKSQMADDGCRTADDGCEVRSGGCGDGQSGETTPEVSQSPIVGYDSNRVIDDSASDKIGILSHEGMDATDRPYRGACDRQSPPSGVKTRENAPNEANQESTQSSLTLEVKSSVPERAGRKRSQSREAVTAGPLGDQLVAGIPRVAT
ncbi:MAG: hypothetical protein ABSH35_19995 [Isosphaeraceae bacterium]|jgi:uncharacterized phage infection (PIP) family protein YhgE